MSKLRFGPATIATAARRQGPPGPVPLLALRQWRAERHARKRGCDFRHQVNGEATAAYSGMSPALFSGINARQAWANWRSIPRSLHGRAGQVPLNVIDLACGSGQSTAVLTHFLPAGTRILGLEYAPRLVAKARLTDFAHADGSKAAVRFAVQDIREAFCDVDGAQLNAGSYDWVNCCGALAHHFKDEDIHLVAAECARVLRPGGYAGVDANGKGDADPVVIAFRAAGFELDGQSRSNPLDKYRQCAFRLRG